MKSKQLLSQALFPSPTLSLPPSTAPALSSASIPLPHTKLQTKIKGDALTQDLTPALHRGGGLGLWGAEEITEME